MYKKSAFSHLQTAKKVKRRNFPRKQNQLMRLKSFRKNADKSIEVVCYPISENSNVDVFFLLEKKLFCETTLVLRLVSNCFQFKCFTKLNFFVFVFHLGWDSICLCFAMCIVHIKFGYHTKLLKFRPFFQWFLLSQNEATA